MTSKGRDRQVIDTIACPVCRAPRGTPCRSKDRQSIPAPHTDRKKLWMMARDGEIDGVPATPRPTATPRPWVAEQRPDGWILRTRYVQGQGATIIAERMTEADAALVIDALTEEDCH